MEQPKEEWYISHIYSSSHAEPWVTLGKKVTWPTGEQQGVHFNIPLEELQKLLRVVTGKEVELL